MRLLAAGGLAAVLALTACHSSPASPPAGGAGSAPAPTPPGTAKALTVTSDFAAGQPIARQHTCKGAGTAPVLHWSGVPAQARSLAVVVRDPDAPSGEFLHWIVVDLPATATSLTAGELPAGAHEAKNSRGTTGWTPPCPPSGTHHYHFTVSALDTTTGVGGGAAVQTALAAVRAHTVAYGDLTGTVAAG